MYKDHLGSGVTVNKPSGQDPVFGGAPDGATMVNSDDVLVTYKPEEGVAGMRDIVPPGLYIKGDVDGIATRLHRDMVYKMPDLSTVV